MKKILRILFIILLLTSLIKAVEENKKENKKEKNKNKKEEDDNKNSGKKAEPLVIDANSNKFSQSGFDMPEEVFNKKLKEIIKKRNLKPKNKIFKSTLKEIFNEIYKEDATVNNAPEDEESKKAAEEEAKQFMDNMFDSVARSLDYDEKIKVKEIKDWICPKRIQEAMNDISKRFAEGLEYL